MKYVSTRGTAPSLALDDVLLTGLARDGGLYMPEAWPRVSEGDLRAMAGLDYADLAVRLMAPYAAGAIHESDLAAIVADAYRDFTGDDVATLVPLGADQWLLELFHGPTLAFKDYALQVVGRLFEHVLARRGERVTLVVATSGDTGSAAIEACRDREGIEIFVLHPKGRVSDVQRRQMTTVLSPNVHNVAIEGTFDDCQALVKAMFNHTAFRDRHRLSAVNSINWARIMAQTVYYFWAALRVGAPDRAVAFSVPTGNFGNVFSGYTAHRMGLPVHRLVVGSNRNDILTRFFHTGRMEKGDVVPTLSPSMDIQVSSNFERLLFELYGRDGARVVAVMDEFASRGAFAVDGAALDEARRLFEGHRFDDDQTKAIIKAIKEKTGCLLDPHSAVGVAAAAAAGLEAGIPVVALATAHPGKFSEAVEAATGLRPPLPERLAGLMERPERLETLPADRGAVEDHIGGLLGSRAPAGTAA